MNTRARDPISIGNHALSGRWKHAPSRLAILFVAFFVGGCGTSGVTRPGPGPDPVTGLPANYVVDYDPVLQTPRNVRNTDALGSVHPGEPAPFTDEVAFQIVRQFVIDYAPVFRFRRGVDDFVVTWAHGQDGLNFVKVQQTYRGLPVDGTGYGTSVLPGRAVGSMIGKFLPNIRISTSPVVSAETAGVRAIRALAPMEVRPISTAKLVILVRDLAPRLAWSVQVQSVGSFASWTVLIDSRDGEVLAVRPNFILD